ncbi:MAG: hypothetical protein J0M18_21040, partial [Ignavibacteria bacterium]|nr:hypothetical protein [Ignavibacteria bacterium]
DCKILSPDSISICNGKIKSLKISCDTVFVSTKLLRGFQYINSQQDTQNSNTLLFTKFAFDLNGLDYNIQSLMGSDKFELLSLTEFKITSLEVTKVSLESFLFKKLSEPSVIINSNNISINNRDDFSISYSISFSISENNSSPEFKLTQSEFLGIPLPSSISNYMFTRYNPIFKGFDAVPVFKTGKLVFSQNKISIKE